MVESQQVCIALSGCFSPQQARERGVLMGLSQKDGHGGLQIFMTTALTHQLPEQKNNMPKISPFLWFNNQAEEAAAFYVSVFSRFAGKDSKVGAVTRYDEASSSASGMPKGTAMTVAFTLAGN